MRWRGSSPQGCAFESPKSVMLVLLEVAEVPNSFTSTKLRAIPEVDIQKYNSAASRQKHAAANDLGLTGAETSYILKIRPRLVVTCRHDGASLPLKGNGKP
mmetsp:Transcript_18562/g.39496  ORF Transcript_18562/g.39496 Transcript_18562/m.39496 type:complete len:101 (+) Transcript_18562:80-382(+)